MSLFTIRKLTPLNIAAINEVPEVRCMFSAVGKTTATVSPDYELPSVARGIADVVARMDGRGHPRSSLHAVRRKVEQLAIANANRTAR